jgi:CBS domain containing-hemolysin-like protein
MLDNSSISSLIGLLVLIALQAFLFSARTAIINVRRTRLKQLQDEGNPTAFLVERLAEDSTRFMATTEVTATFIHLLAAVMAALTFGGPLAAQIGRVAWLTPAAGWLAALIVIFVLGLVMLIFGQLLPSLLALNYAERVALNSARWMSILGILTWPLARLVVGASHLLAGHPGAGGEAGLPFITEEEIKTMVDAGEEGGVIAEDEKEMIYNIFTLGDTLVREVMVPRIDILAVDVASPLLEALNAILAAGHSRVPVYRDTIDNVIGLLYIKDVLPLMLQCRTDAPLTELLREPFFVPETKKADDLLLEMQSRKVHMAIVVDEYGGTAGLITIEDLLEEIVGEIQDEYDSEEPVYEAIGDNEYLMKARMNLDDVAQLLEVELPDEDSDTLGGFIVKRLGRVPAAGDMVEHNGLRLVIQAVNGRRIDDVRVTRLPPAEPAGEGARPETEE